MTLPLHCPHITEEICSVCEFVIDVYDTLTAEIEEADEKPSRRVRALRAKSERFMKAWNRENARWQRVHQN